MSRMAESFFAVSPLLALPLVAMLLFGAVFVGITLRTLRTPRAEMDERRAMPFEESSHE